MVDALGGLARTDSQKDSTRHSRSTDIAAIRWATSLAQERNENINRFTQAVNARYYPFAWLNTRANLGFDYTLLNAQEPDPVRPGSVRRDVAAGQHLRLSHGELAVHARRRRDGHVQPAQQRQLEDVGRSAVLSHVQRPVRFVGPELHAGRHAGERGRDAVGDVGHRPHDHAGQLRRTGLLVQRPPVPHGPRSLRRQQLVR